ncbi:hypothetical protein CGMCC3_g14707 [Colletotrichum fructicola]|nr:uncharacterized protein CGMCC3_g14707 [Colletotrichum fructicola]KAE9569146.1 hypothetical protein CGMCC3_g14707 [Colletotrichum fructicola]
MMFGLQSIIAVLLAAGALARPKALQGKHLPL